MVYGSAHGQRGSILGCANIQPSIIANEEIEISFPGNGTNPEDIDRYASNLIMRTYIHVCMNNPNMLYANTALHVNVYRSVKCKDNLITMNKSMICFNILGLKWVISCPHWLESLWEMCW